jgi:hypothetical protein
MNESKLATLEQIGEFPAGTSDAAFAIPAEEPRLRVFVAKVLQRFRHFSCPKGQRGLLFEYVQRLATNPFTCHFLHHHHTPRASASRAACPACVR